MRKGYGSGVWIKGMDHAVPQGMDQGMDRGVWIVCGFGALIHTLYFDSYPYIYIVHAQKAHKSGATWCHAFALICGSTFDKDGNSMNSQPSVSDSIFLRKPLD